jgi:hypothetical protein
LSQGCAEAWANSGDNRYPGYMFGIHEFTVYGKFKVIPRFYFLFTNSTTPGSSFIFPEISIDSLTDLRL